MRPDQPDRHRPPSGAELRDLAGLADGSLSPLRRARLERRLRRSPALRAALERQRLALATMGVLRAEARAPARLRAWVEAADQRRNGA